MTALRSGRGRPLRSTSTRSTRRDRRSRSSRRSGTAPSVTSSSATNACRRGSTRCGTRCASHSRRARACCRSVSSTSRAHTPTPTSSSRSPKWRPSSAPRWSRTCATRGGVLEAVGELVEVAGALRRAASPTHLKSLADEALIEPLLEFVGARRCDVRPVPVRRGVDSARLAAPGVGAGGRRRGDPQTPCRRADRPGRWPRADSCACSRRATRGRCRPIRRPPTPAARPSTASPQTSFMQQCEGREAFVLFTFYGGNVPPVRSGGEAQAGQRQRPGRHDHDPLR